MIGDWSGTFTVDRMLPDGSHTVNTCTQRWTIVSQTGGQFVGTFELSGGTIETCAQTGTIFGSVTTGGAVTNLGATNTNPTPCIGLIQTGFSGVVSGGALTVQWNDQIACDGMLVVRTIAVAMTRR